MSIKADSTGLASILALLLTEHDEGNLPVKLIERFFDNPWSLLSEGEVYEMPFQCIPKGVKLSSVKVIIDGDRAIAVGIRANDTFWSSELHVPKFKLMSLCPFIMVDDEPMYLVRRDEWVHDSIDGRFCGHRILCRDPFIFWNANQRFIETDGLRYFVGERSKTSDPVGAILVSGGFYFWNSLGHGYVPNGHMNNGGDFIVPQGYTVHSGAQAGNVIRSTFAVVFRRDAEIPSFQIVVYRDGQWIMETTNEYASISTPVIRSDGTVFVRIEGSLMRLSPKAVSFETVEEIAGDPWIGGDDVVFATTATGTLQIWLDNQQSILEHAETLFAKWPYIGIRYEREGTPGMEILKFGDDGSIEIRHTYGMVSIEGYKFLMTFDGYELSLWWLGDGERRVLHVVEEGSEDPMCERLEIVGNEDDVFDLRQAVTKGFRVYTVVQHSGRDEKWSVVMNGPNDQATPIGEPSDAIFHLRIEGPLLRWYRRIGNKILDCRMYIGE